MMHALTVSSPCFVANPDLPSSPEQPNIIPTLDKLLKHPGVKLGLTMMQKSEL
jgi:hypothetical protein